MNQQELDALLVATDMPRAVDAQIQGDDEVKFSIHFVKPDEPGKIAEAYGAIVQNPSVAIFSGFADHARRLVEEKRPSLVPYDSIYRADNDNAPALEVAA